MEKNNKYATFFGGALNDTTTIEYSDSITIGELLATYGYIIKSGGYRGLMEAVSKGGKEKGTRVIGYTCQSFHSTKGNDYLDETYPSKDIYDRLRCLIEGTSLYVVQKGGIGTLAELFLVLDIYRKTKEKPTIVLYGNHWHETLRSIPLTEKEKELFEVVSTMTEFQWVLSRLVTEA